MTDVDDLVPLKDAARALGKTTATMQAWVRDGKSHGAVKVGPRDPWWIPRSEVARPLEERAAQEQAGRQRPSFWTPMTERPEFSGRPNGEEGLP